MPYIHIEPELFVTHGGVDVYCTYDDGGYCGPSKYWFTTDPDNADEFHGHGNRGQFDARQFARLCEGTPSVDQWERFWRPRFMSEDEAVTALIRTEIDAGRLATFSEGA